MPNRPPSHKGAGHRDPAERKRDHERRRGSFRERGYSTLWDKARAAHLREHPGCAMCEREGRYTSATVVDHIAPHRGDPNLFWNTTNWQSLCKPHHDSDKQRAERGPVREDVRVMFPQRRDS